MSASWHCSSLPKRCRNIARLIPRWKCTGFRAMAHLHGRAGSSMIRSQRRQLGNQVKESEILTPRQLAVLVTVAQSDGLIQMRIAEQTGIDKATLTSLM